MNKRSTAPAKQGDYKRAFFSMLPILIMAGLVPLLVYGCRQDITVYDYPFYRVPELYVDYWLLPKSYALTGLLVVMAVLVALKLFLGKRERVFCRIFVPLLVYIAMMILSSVFSVCKKYTLYGGYAQFESVWVLLCYVLAVYYVYLFAQSETELLVLKDAFCFSATAVGFLGVLEVAGIIWFENETIQNLLTPQNLQRMKTDIIRLEFAFKGQAISTMYNPNYLGTFCAIMLPFLIGLIIFEKKLWRKIWQAVAAVLVGISLLASNSRTGELAAIFALAFLVLCLGKIWMKHRLVFISLLVLVIAAFLGGDLISRHLITQRLSQAFHEMTQKEEPKVLGMTDLSALYIGENGIMLERNDRCAEVCVYMENNGYTLYALDGAGERMALEQADTEGIFYFTDAEFNPFIIYSWRNDSGLAGDITDSIGVSLAANEKEWHFVYNKTEDKYYYINDNNFPSDMVKGKRIGFAGREQMFSGRGIIWSQSLAMVKDFIFIGCGPDAFPFVYPHNDYFGRYLRNGLGLVTTRPHNMYLQTSIQTGFISLLALLVFYFWYAVQSLKLYFWKNITTETEIFGAACFFGTVGYMLAGLANDSLVVTAPLFWVMIGGGIVANLLNRQKKTES